MITRLWFVLSLVWAALALFNCATRTVPSFTTFDFFFVFGPFIAGLALKWTGRYVVTGSLRPLPRRRRY